MLERPRTPGRGIVELVDVVPVPEPGGFVPKLGDCAPGEFVYLFEDPMEIMPVEGVRGKRDLWELDEITESRVWEAERTASFGDISRIEVDRGLVPYLLTPCWGRDRR